MKTPFIGRVRDLGLCENLLADPSDRARVITVSAPPGMGKTAFAHRVIGTAENLGWSVYTASLAEGRDDPPLHPWIQVLEAMSVELEPGPSSLFPALYGAWEAVPEATGMDEVSRKPLLFHLVGEYVARVSKDRPLLICLDNIHLCDGSSVTLTKYLLELLPRRPLVFVLTFRPREAADRRELVELLDALQLVPLWEDLRLAELGPTEIRESYELLRSANADLPDCETLINATGGNPLRLAAFLLDRSERGGSESPLDTLWRAYRGRFAGRAGRFLEALSILGNRLTQADLDTAIAVLGDRSSAELRDDALYYGMLEKEGETYRFFHDDVRTLVRDSIPQEKRAELRDRLVHQLRLAVARDAELSIVRLAGLYLETEDSPERDEYLSRAAAVLEERTAWPEAARYHEALAAAARRRGDEAARDSAEVRAFRCYAMDLDRDQVSRLSHSLAARLLRRDDEVNMRLLVDANPFALMGQSLFIKPILDRLKQVTPLGDSRRPRIILRTLWFSSCDAENRQRQALELEALADEVLAKGSDPDRYLLYERRADLALKTKRLDEAMEHMARAARLSGSRYRYEHLFGQAWACFYMKDFGPWDEIVGRVEEAARTTQVFVVREYLEGLLQRRYLYEGDFANVLAFGEDEADFVNHHLLPRVLAHFWMGNCDRGHAMVDRLSRKVRHEHETVGYAWMLPHLAWVFSLDVLFCGSEENIDLIVEGVRYQLQENDETDNMTNRQQVLVAAARICDRTWTDEENAAIYDRLRALDDFYLDEEIHSVEIAKAMFADRLGDPEAALHHYEAAIAWSEKVGEWPWRSWVWARLADRGVAGAREKALEIARRIGNVYVLEMLGETSAEPKGPEGPLSGREIEVIDLAAKGYTDREIGGYLNISEHTVANHLRKIFRKLGAVNRVEASRIALRDGIIDN